MNRDGFNRLAVHVAPWLPGMGVVVHRGRRSGRAYRTPVMVFRHADRLVIALPYGTDTDWLRNVLAAGSATVVDQGTTYTVSDPQIVPTSEAEPHLPPDTLRTLRVFRVEECLRVRRAPVDAQPVP